MRTRPFGRLGWPVSVIGLGTWNIAGQWGPVDEATAIATVRAAIDAGVTLIDTADSYGDPQGLSEDRVGKAIAGRRDGLTVVTKVGKWGRVPGQPMPAATPASVQDWVHASLGRLGTEMIDVVLCHDALVADPAPYLDAFQGLKDEGRIRAFGLTTHDLAALQRFDHDGRCDVVELDYSLLNRSHETDLLPYCHERGIAVIARGPLGRGLLAGRYDTRSVFKDTVRASWNAGGPGREGYERQIAQVAALAAHFPAGPEILGAALGFAQSHPDIAVAIAGAKSPEQARMNAAAGGQALSAAARGRMAAVVAG